MSEETTINGMPKGHMERYHPHGIREGDICKYLQGIEKTTAQPKGANDKNRYATLAEEITADKASLWRNTIGENYERGDRDGRW